MVQPAERHTMRSESAMNELESYWMGEFTNTSTVCAVLENRAREICVCKISMSHLSTIEIHLVSDCHSYVETMMLLESLSPQEILLRDGTSSSTLSKKVTRYVDTADSDARILYISRQYFDQDRGYELLKHVIAGVVDADLVAKYVVLAGCFALLRYVENIRQQTFAASSMRLVSGRDNTGGHLLIDRRTALNLELVNNARSGRQKDSVFGCIDYTRTAVGARFLRSTLLNPLNSLETINMRLDFVEQLVHNRMGLVDCTDILVQFPDLDKMLNGLSVRAKTLTPKTVRQGIDTLIYVKHSLLLAPALVAALDVVEHDTAGIPQFVEGSNPSAHPSLIVSIKESLRSTEYEDILSKISNLLSDSTAYSKNAHEMRHTECFAIHSGVNSFLDLARSTFLQCVEDVYALAQSYADQITADVRVSHSVSRGYFLQVACTEAELPAFFVQAVQNRRTISCTTPELASLSDRATEAINTALQVTDDLIQDLMKSTRVYSEILFVFVDSVALLDILCSFAELANRSPDVYCRPSLETSGPLVIQDGHHVILHSMEQQQQSKAIFGQFVVNDTYLSPLDSFQIITGCNGAGKSTYIKQVALIIVMAQIGSFVPAKHATIPLRDRMLSRIGVSDDMEHNLSSFHTEMKECSYILDNVTHLSFVIIDELGRGTSNKEGFAIAMAVAEELIDSNAYCFFVTHFVNMTSLEDLYPSVRNIHLNGDSNSSQEQGLNTGNRLQFFHKLGTGPCRLESGYGIAMAEQCGFPEVILADAIEYSRALGDTSHAIFGSTAVNKNIAVLNALLDNLLVLKNSTLSTDGLRNYLQRLQDKLTLAQFADLRKLVNNLYDKAITEQQSDPPPVPFTKTISIESRVQIPHISLTEVASPRKKSSDEIGFEYNRHPFLKRQKIDVHEFCQNVENLAPNRKEEGNCQVDDSIREDARNGSNDKTEILVATRTSLVEEASSDEGVICLSGGNILSTKYVCGGNEDEFAINSEDFM